MTPILVTLSQNAVLLLAMMVAFDLVTSGKGMDGQWQRQVLTGVILGGLSIGLMLTSFRLAAGIIFDTRSVLLSLSGLFFGPIAAVFAMAMAVAYRLWHGGTGMWTGIWVILATGGVGILWRHYRQGRLSDISLQELYGFGMVVHLVMLALMLTLPWEEAWRVLGGISLPVLLVYPLATVALGWLLTGRLQREDAQAAMAASERRHRSLFEAANVGKSVTLPTGEIQVNRAFCDMLGYSPEELRGKTWQELTPAEEIGPINDLLAPLICGEKDAVRFEKRYLHKNGSHVWADVSTSIQRGRDGNPLHYVTTVVDITERKQQEEALRRIEWMLTPDHTVAGDNAAPTYGDLTDHNTERTILDAVGPRLLEGIVRDYLDLLDTSAAVYERNGDYALGIFSSGWCRYLDEASRRLCGTEDNVEALACGRWLCHESCWTEASKRAIERGEVTDIECAGGLRLHAVPIRAGDRIVGVINFGYGDPPREPQVLRDLAEKYNVAVDELARHAAAYESRPPYIVAIAKRRIESSARLIGEIVLGKQNETRIEHLNRVLRAIRDVNQLITHEKDRDTLLLRSCEILISTRGYRSAWVALRGEDGTAQRVAESGIGVDFAPLRVALEQGDWPDCCRQAWDHPDGVAPIHNTDSNCKTCRLCHTYRDTAALAGALRYGVRDYGVLVVALPVGLADDPEELTLFRELVGDVAYALHAMDLAQEHKEATQALLLREAHFRLVVENAPDAIFVQTRHRFAYLNPAAVRYFGAKSADQLLDQPVLDRFEPHFHDLVRERIRQLNEERTAVPMVEQVYLRMDGSPFHVEVTAVPIQWQGQNGALVFFRDITKRKRAEAEREKLQSQLTQAQKLESVGRLAGGVAHDYNNMLSVIIGYTELALDKVTPDNPLRGDLKEVFNAARRSADITRQLLAFARRQTIAPKVIDLNETVEAMLKMLRRLIGEDIDLSWQPGPGRMPVFLDPSQLDQLLANLCINARDAIDGVGNLTIETDHVCFDAEYCVLSAGVCGVIFSGEVSSFPCVLKGPWSDEIEDPPGREALSAGRVFGSDQPGLSSL